MRNKMIRKIFENIENNIININDVEYLLSLNNSTELNILYNYSKKINRKNLKKITYETNIYYPAIYQIENNCPTCGYRTSESKQKYTEDFIRKNIEFKLSDIKKYPISGINCYNKDAGKNRELFIILEYLKNYNIRTNVRVSDYNQLKLLKKYDITSIIFQTSKNKYCHFNENFNQNKIKDDNKILKYIKENMKIKIIYEYLISYGESYHDIFEKIKEIQKYNIDSIEIKGYDPFIDTPEEYNPQYTKEYILKNISILRAYFNNIEIKIQYATNNNNYFSEYKELGINTFTGIYTPYMNTKLQNVDII